MRLITQAAIIVVLAGLGGGAWYLWQQHAENGAAATPAGAQRRAGGQTLPVDVVAARSDVVAEKVESVGTARANESVVITAKQTGNVLVINFDEGQRVRAGHMLIELETRERKADIDQAKSDLDQSKAVRDDAKSRLDRARQLRGSGNVTEARLDELEAALRGAEARVRSAEARVRSLDARLDDVRITAPFDGRVGIRQVSPGALVQPGTPITTLDDISKIKFDFSVPETVLGQLRPGLVVVARSVAFPDRVFEGVVSIVDTRVDPITRAVRVNALFENPDEALRPGMFLSLDMALSRRDNAVLVPEEAIIPEGVKHFVFVIVDNRAHRREVQIGARLPGEVEIRDGLKAGETVVVRGVQRVRDGQQVNPRPLPKPGS
ncbi:MAG TPA: efflux RND transporter periplasmic adaptor subunit [Alphaproteobacteria bacterium]|nr:efflux RND transporter periplasmic adaptor subunit [Alphaproteobacteria bacterium]